MALRFKSLSDDKVDSITNTWTVILFLFLALLLLVIPATQRQQKTQATPETETYIATCWTPAHYTASFTRYANEVCSNAFQDMMSGIYSNQSEGATIHETRPLLPSETTTTTTTVQPINQTYNYNTTNDSGNKKNDNIDNNMEGEDTKDEYNIMQRLGIRITPPVMIFLLAIGLCLPKILFSMFRQCAGTFDMEATLECAKNGESMTGDQRREMYSYMVTPLISKPPSCFKSYTTFYSFVKLAVLIVIIIELTVLHQNLTSDLKKKPTPIENEPKQIIRHCSFNIRQMGNMIDYTIQCSFTKTSPPKQESQKPMVDTKNDLENNCYVVAFVCLCLLLVINVVNTILVSFSLLFMSEGNQPLDLKLLKYKAMANLSSSAAFALSEAISSGSTAEPNDQVMLLEKV